MCCVSAPQRAVLARLWAGSSSSRISNKGLSFAEFLFGTPGEMLVQRELALLKLSENITRSRMPRSRPQLSGDYGQQAHDASLSFSPAACSFQAAEVRAGFESEEICRKASI